jgi:hypothetical protein
MKSLQIHLRIHPSNQPTRFTHILIRGRSMEQTFRAIIRAVPMPEVKTSRGWRDAELGPVYTKR